MSIIDLDRPRPVASSRARRHRVRALFALTVSLLLGSLAGEPRDSQSRFDNTNVCAAAQAAGIPRTQVTVLDGDHQVVRIAHCPA